MTTRRLPLDVKVTDLTLFAAAGPDSKNLLHCVFDQLIQRTGVRPSEERPNAERPQSSMVLWRIPVNFFGIERVGLEPVANGVETPIVVCSYRAKSDVLNDRYRSRLSCLELEPFRPTRRNMFAALNVRSPDQIPFATMVAASLFCAAQMQNLRNNG